MPYVKKDIYKITKRLYYLLRNHPNWIVFKQLRGACGYYEEEAEEITITLDPRKEIIAALVHEALHHWYPTWSETIVLQNEKQIMNALTSRQIRNIIKVMANNL